MMAGRSSPPEMIFSSFSVNSRIVGESVPTVLVIDLLLVRTTAADTSTGPVITVPLHRDNIRNMRTVHPSMEQEMSQEANA